MPLEKPPAGAKPLELGQAKAWVGTCSWTDPTLVKETSWYPKRTMSAAERLAYYASKFPVVEVDSSYYRPLTPQLARTWAERAPAGFSFDVKAYGLLTGHPVSPETLWPDIKKELRGEGATNRRVYAHHLPSDALEESWARFVGSLAPLSQAGCLGAVLFQYPPWFAPKKASFAELERLAGRARDLPACVELRSPGWYEGGNLERVLELFRELGLAWVVVDAPRSSGLPTLLEVTSGLAVARFHGRNDSTWQSRAATAAERFRYLYSEEELSEWAKKALHLARMASSVHLLMNNCYQDYGVRNAAQLASLLSAGADAELR